MDVDKRSHPAMHLASLSDYDLFPAHVVTILSQYDFKTVENRTLVDK